MTDTMTSTSATARTYCAAATILGGLAMTVLGAAAAVSPDIVTGGWFAAAGGAALLLVAGILGLRRAVARSRTAPIALAAAAMAMTLFALAHFYALIDQDTAILLFSVFMVLAAVALIVAGAAALRARAGTPLQRAALLFTGVWPIATIPAGAAIGDLPHFLAIAVWGVGWAVTGASLLAQASPSTARQMADRRRGPVGSGSPSPRISAAKPCWALWVLSFFPGVVTEAVPPGRRGVQGFSARCASRSKRRVKAGSGSDSLSRDRTGA